MSRVGSFFFFLQYQYLFRRFVKKEYVVILLGYFFLLLEKPMLWILIRTTSMRCFSVAFNEYSQYVYGVVAKYSFITYPLICLSFNSIFIYPFSLFLICLSFFFIFVYHLFQFYDLMELFRTGGQMPDTNYVFMVSHSNLNAFTESIW